VILVLTMIGLGAAGVVGILTRAAYALGARARDRRRILEEQLLAELRLQELTWSAMERMVSEARRSQGGRA
jgi:hypothetical protein